MVKNIGFLTINIEAREWKNPIIAQTSHYILISNSHTDQYDTQLILMILKT